MTLSLYKSLEGITTTATDALITHWLAVAKEAADEYLNNPFHERDWDEDSANYGKYKSPAVELAIPQLVEEGVRQWVLAQMGARKSERRVKSKSAGGWTKTYIEAEIEAEIEKIEAKFWGPHRLKAGV